MAEGGAIAANGLAGIVNQVVNYLNVMSQVMSSPQFMQAFQQYTTTIGQVSGALFDARQSYYDQYGDETQNNTSQNTSNNNNNNTRDDPVKEAYDALVSAINKQKELLQKQLDSIKEIMDITSSGIKDLLNQADSTKSMQSEEARAYLRTVSTDILRGILPDSKKYQEAIASAIGGVNSAVYATKADEDRAKLLLANELQAIADTLAPQKTDIERQLEYLDGLLITAKQQLDALLGSTSAVTTLAQVIENWAAVTGNVLPSAPTTPVASSNFGLSSLSTNIEDGWRTNTAANDALIDEVKALKDEIVKLRAEVRADVFANSRTAKILERVTPDGGSLQTSAV